MGGGRGAGFFAGTDGWRASEAFDKGTLVAAAARNTATDAGSTSGGMLDALRPWWSYPYGHPEKTKKIEMMQKALKPRAEQLSGGFRNLFDPELAIIKYGFELLKEATTKGKKSRKTNNIA